MTGVNDMETIGAALDYGRSQANEHLTSTTAQALLAVMAGAAWVGRAHRAARHVITGLTRSPNEAATPNCFSTPFSSSSAEAAIATGR